MAQKCPVYLILNIKEIFLKNQKVTFSRFLMPFILCNFNKSIEQIWRMVRKCWFWAQKWSIYPILGKTIILLRNGFCCFMQKSERSHEPIRHFLVFIESQIHAESKNKIMSRSWEHDITDSRMIWQNWIYRTLCQGQQSSKYRQVTGSL